MARWEERREWFRCGERVMWSGIMGLGLGLAGFE